MDLKKEYVLDDVWKIENFITDEECSIIMQDCTNEDNWFGEPGAFENGNKNVLTNETKNALAAINSRIEKIMNTEYEVANTTFNVQRITVNSGPGGIWALPPHRDNYDISDSKYVTRGYVLYLNDNFEGGQLNFRDHDISIQPKAGLLASFSGGHHNIHEVQIVTEGERYTVGSFWDNEESEYSEETKEKWKTEIAEARIRQAEDQKLWQENKSKGIMEEPPPNQKEKLKINKETL